MRCLRPVFIERRRSLLGAKHVSERLAKIKHVCEGVPFVESMSGMYVSSYGAMVPCGKCSECLKRRQSDLAARCAAEATRCGSMVFVTLTYDEDNLPLSCRLEHIDKSTGEITYDHDLVQMRRRFRNDVDSDLVQDVLRSIKISSSGPYRFVVKDLCEFEDEAYRLVVTPSLCNRDVQMWLKRSRVMYERIYKSKLPDFKYVLVGEYGNHGTKRPHYHLAFFGLDKSHVDFLVSLWNYGFTYVQWVNSINEDGTDGFALAAKYIGKYMTKGKFDCQSVHDRFAFKSRICASKHLGGKLAQPLVDYFRCYDLVGEYDIERPLSQDKLKIVLSELPKRCKISINSSVFVLPNVFKRQLWYVKDSDKVFRSSVVRMQIASALQTDLVHDYYQELRKSCPFLSEGEISSMVARFRSEQEAIASITDERQMLTLQQFYLTSKF